MQSVVPEFLDFMSKIHGRVIPQYCPKIGVFKINFFLFAKMIFSPKTIFSITETIYERDKKKIKKIKDLSS